MSKASLEKKLARSVEGAKEIAFMESAPILIRAEIDRIVETLSDVPARFFILGPEKGELSPDQVAMLAELRNLREQFELAPGVLVRCRRKHEADNEDLRAAVEAETAALREIALKQRDRFSKAITAELTARFGDSDATKRMIVPAVMSCPSNNAIETMRHLSSNPAAAARALIKVRESLESNETAAHSTPAAS